MMDTSRDLISFNLTGKLMALLFQMTLSLVMADAARLSFLFTSSVELPSLDKVEPRYLKLSTSSRFCPFSMMEVAACWVRIFTVTLLFSALTSIPYARAVLSSLMVKSWSSASMLPMRSMSSAKCRLHSARPPMEMEIWRLWRVSYEGLLQIDVEQNCREQLHMMCGRSLR